MPRVSVLVTTYRLGGVDVLLQSLKRQTMQDFELVLVDSIQAQRRDSVADYARRLKMDDKVIHVEPANNEMPYKNVASAYNDAIRRSKGELLVFWSDFSFAHRACIERHWQNYARSGESASTLGSYRYVDYPGVAGDVREAIGRLAIRDYLEFAKRRSADFGVSIMEKEFGPDDASRFVIRDTIGRVSRDVPLMRVRPGSTVSGLFWNFKNDSVPRELCVKINGLDLAFMDWYNDADFGNSLNRLRHKLVFDPFCRLDVMMNIDMFPDTIRRHTLEYETAKWREKWGMWRRTPESAYVLAWRLGVFPPSPRLKKLLSDIGLGHYAIYIYYWYWRYFGGSQTQGAITA